MVAFILGCSEKKIFRGIHTYPLSYRSAMCGLASLMNLGAENMLTLQNSCAPLMTLCHFGHISKT